jgi:hypothetical protein
MDVYGSTALHRACRRGATNIVKLLLEHGAGIATAGWTYGYNSFMEATTAHRTLVLELLLNHLLSSCGRRGKSGASGNKEEEEGGHEAERVRRISSVLNARQHKGQTALAISASSPGMREEAALLLQAGASPFIPDNDGHLPVDRARLAQQPVFFMNILEEAMREPQRAWRLAQARAVLDARQALHGVLAGGEEEEDGKERGGKEGTKEGGVLEIMKVIPACFRNRFVRRLGEEENREEEVPKEGGKKGGKEGARTLSDGLLEALPSVEWTREGQEEEEPIAGGAATAAAAAFIKKEEKRRRLLATMAFVMEGGLKEELWVELREYFCVRYDGAAWARLGEAGKWW